MQQIFLKRILIGLVLSVFFGLAINAQGDSLVLSGVEDTSSLEYSGSSHSLYLSTGYGSNMIYMGSTMSSDMPYYHGSVTWGFKDELFATVTAFKLSAFDPFPAFYNLSLNYSHVFNSWFDISMGISRYQVDNELTDTLFSNFFYGDMTLGIDWKILYSKLSVGSVLSEESGIYFDLKNSRYFQTPEFLKKKVYISFDPYIDLLFGKLTKITTSEGTSIGVSSPFQPGKFGDGGGKNSSSSSQNITYSTIFGLTEASMALPVAFNTNILTLEVEPGYVIPLFTEEGFQSPSGFVFLLSCYLKIF